MSSIASVSLALSFAISAAPLANAFAPDYNKPHCHNHHLSSSELNYRSLHHGHDVEPLSDMERQGADFTKMHKDQIDRYGPGDFVQYVELESSDLFDDGDSEMGMVGDGGIGIKKFGRDALPHMTRSLTAKIDKAIVASASDTNELLHNNPGMDAVYAKQLENWATQNELAMSNRYTNEGIQDCQEYYRPINEYGGSYEEESSFNYPLEAGEDLEGIITLRAPINRVAVHDIMLKNPNMGYAKFRAAFVGDASNEWSVSSSDSFLKQNEATHFVLKYDPVLSCMHCDAHNSGVSTTYFVIETEDFKQTWKVVGSTGEYEF